MKLYKYLLGLTAAFWMGCSEQELPGGVEPEGNRLTLTAVMGESEGQTRVSIQNQGTVLWEPGDCFTAFNAGNQGAVFTLEDAEYVSQGKFSSTEKVAGPFVQAGFPTFCQPGFDGSRISFVLPTAYSVEQNTQNAAMWGEIVANHVTFRHLMGVVRIYAGDLDAAYDQITVETDRVIAGKFSQSVTKLAEGLAAEAGNTEAANKVVTITRNLTKMDVYVALPAGTYGKIVIQAKKSADSSAEPKVLVNAANKTVKCGYVYTVGKRGVSEKIFSLLNLNYPGLSEVKTAYNGGDLKQAAAALLTYYRTRTNVVNPEIQDIRANAKDRNVANQALEYRFMVAKFVEDDKGTTDTKDFADDVYYSFKKADGSINWGFRPEVTGIDREFNYQQHRHQWMEPQAKAYAVTKNEEYVKSWMEVYDSWMKRYPCPNKAFSNPSIANLEAGYEWKALQPAQRVEAQLNYLPLFIQSANMTPEFFTKVMTALGESVEMIRMNYISEGNIRLTQGEAVAKAGLLMPEFKNADAWIKDGVEKMNFDEQFLADGVHVDLCFGYHMGSLGNFIKINNLVKANNRTDVFSADYIKRLKNAVSFVEAMLYPDYTVDNFNDSHSGSYQKSTLQNRLKEYLAIFPEDEELKWMAYEGKNGGTKPTWQNKAFSVGGYYMLKSHDWSANSGLMVIHSNNYNPTMKWHCQQDNGTFSLWFNGTNFLPDAGYYTYADPDPTGMRQKYRSYTMHNTLSCFGKDIMDRQQLGKMLKQESGKDYELIVTENMPYKKGDNGVDGDVRHRRAIYLVDNKFVVVVDEGFSAEPNFNIKMNLNFHLYAEKGKHAEIVHRPSAEEPYALVKTTLDKNNLLLKCFSETSAKKFNKDFAVDSPSDLKVSNSPGKTIGETRDYIRITERKGPKIMADRFITVFCPSAGAADVNREITAKFTDNEAGKEGTFHENGAAVEVTVDGKTYKLAYQIP